MTEPSTTNFRWAAKARTWIVFCLAGALAGAGLYLGNTAIIRLSDTCASNSATDLQHTAAGDCVGYTSGDYAFTPSLAAAERQIAAENQRVTATGQYVSIVVLLPISVNNDSGVMPPTAVLNQLRGAYAAQAYANGHDTSGPRIRLLIGNAGAQASEWQAATSVIESTAASQHIAAVTGLGASLATTLKAAKNLTAARIPVVGSTVSGDDFDNIQNMVRVSPTIADEASAATAFATRDHLSKPVLVEDPKTGDTYSSALATDFERHLAARTTITKETYGDNGEVLNRLGQIAFDLCRRPSSTALFAGRGSNLAELVVALGSTCPGIRTTIITGDDAANMPITPAVKRALGNGVTVDYAGMAYPGSLPQQTSPAGKAQEQGLATFEAACQATFLNQPSIDQNLMLSYDATLTAIAAIHLAGQPTPTAVAAELPALQGSRTVLGATGPLAFGINPRSVSNPVGKAVPMLRIDPDGNPRLLELTWPEGQPPAS